MHALYRKLFALRRSKAALRTLDLAAVETHADDERGVLLLRRWAENEQVLVAFNFSAEGQSLAIPFRGASWRSLMETGAVVEGSTINLPPAGFGVFEVTS